MTTVDLTDASTANQAVIAEYCAEFVMGWRWVSWIGRPVKGTEGYPSKCRVRQFVTSEQAAKWMCDEHRLLGVTIDATGNEPLSYAYCSSGSIVPVPNPFESWADDGAVLVHVRETWEPERYRRFASYLHGIWSTAAGNRIVGADCGLETQWVIPGNSDDWPELGTVYYRGDYCLTACRVIQGEDNADS